MFRMPARVDSFGALSGRGSIGKMTGTSQIALKGLTSFACPRRTKSVERRNIEELCSTPS